MMTMMMLLLEEVGGLMREGRAGDALPIALRALSLLRLDDAAAATATAAGAGAGGGGEAATKAALLPALNAVAEIYLELGNASAAHDYFLQAVNLDPCGETAEAEGGGAGKFLWLAQLSEEGGRDSVGWFERGAAVLRVEIGAMEKEEEGEEGQEKRKQLAGALCGMVEVYMTDLSWEACAERECESLIAEALLVAPHCAEPLQTLASVRISQARIAEAKRALRDSMAIWEDVDAGDGAVPDFSTRVSLARLLMEVGMEEEALRVLERLVREDDGSVEAWYLGGWCLYLLGVGRRREGEEGGDVMEVVDRHEKEDEDEGDVYTHSMISSREWLRQSLKLYELVEYEDERLRDHAVELVEELDAIIGEKGEEDEGEEEWDGLGSENEEEQENDEDMDEG